MDDELETLVRTDLSTDAAEVRTPPAAVIDGAQSRSGPVHWFRAPNGLEFAVREGTPEHKLLERRGADPIEGPKVRATPEPSTTAEAAPKPQANRSTVATREAARR